MKIKKLIRDTFAIWLIMVLIVISIFFLISCLLAAVTLIVIAIAIRDTVIEKGDRIAQFRIMKNQPRIDFERVLHLNKKSRGGIGSTGRR